MQGELTFSASTQAWAAVVAAVFDVAPFLSEMAPMPLGKGWLLYKLLWKVSTSSLELTELTLMSKLPLA